MPKRNTNLGMIRPVDMGVSRNIGGYHINRYDEGRSDSRRRRI